MASSMPLRHELKFFISEMQYIVLSGVLDQVLHRDPNGDELNEYHIRSLYFDTVFNDAYYDKLDGQKNRDKYRIRIYNLSDRLIKLECKTKVGNLISKRPQTIPRDLCEQLMAGDPTGLETTRSGLLNDVYREMTVNLLHPVVLVDYVREAYLHTAEEVRITFDKTLTAMDPRQDLFDPAAPGYHVLPPGQMILEVKFTGILPEYIQSIFRAYSFVRTSASKFCLCVDQVRHTLH